MRSSAKIFVAGHRGMVGSALVRKLHRLGFGNVLTRGHDELDLLDQRAVVTFLAAERPDYIFIAAAKVGGIQAELVAEIVQADDTAARRDHLVKSAGFQAYDYNE